MRFFKVRISILVLVLGLSLSACCSPCRKAAQMSKASFAGVEWKLVQWDSEKVSATGMNTFTVIFTHDGKVSGFGDCNRFSGSYTYTNTGKLRKLSIGQLATTRMACPDQGKEDRFLEALKNTERFGVDSGLLMLDSGGTKLVFERK